MGRESLQQYRAKRDFRRTPEPKGRAAREAVRNRFVVQKHAARRLHYDFRLELGGTLKSWAVPKGPSFNPDDKRLAVQVEDHPLEYAAFEGIIPKDQYGGGTVMVWDQGRWESHDPDPQIAYNKGHLHFTLHGAKIQGRWSLVRMHSRDSEDINWLLIKHHDDYASTLDAEDLDARSAVTQRTMEEIALDKDQVWNSDRGEAVSSKPTQRPKAPSQGRKAPLPDFIPPQLATVVDTPPEGGEWLHEIKYDGYRIHARVDHKETTLVSRNAKDWTGRFPLIRRAVENLGFSTAWLDGELCFLKADGTTSFQELQNALDENDDKTLVYFVFDVLYANGKDLTQLTLLERKQLLAGFLKNTGDPGPVRYADHLLGQGGAFFEQACKHGLEGAIAKRANRPHVSGRGREWLKIKCLQRQEFVIGGYTRPKGARSGFGALLLGVYEDGKFVYTGKVGTGFTETSLRHLFGELERLRSERPAYDQKPPREIARSAIWVKPQRVAEIEFIGWTRDGYLRQPSFKGLREDKRPELVGRERVQPLTQPAPQRGGHKVGNVALSNPDKLLYKRENITKRDLARYYEYVTQWMLPHVLNRPLTLLRCPDGYEKECFFQKHDDASLSGLGRVTVMEKGKPAEYMSIERNEGLISLVQMGVLEIHISGARAGRLDFPDIVVFDIDPQENLPWKAVIGGAQTLHTLLSELGLRAFAKATGGKGLHVVVPIEPSHGWMEVKAFAKAVAGTLMRFDPSLYTLKVAKQARHGKMYIDYVRNSQGATAVAPYSTRARAGAPAAVPLSWDEIDRETPSNYFTVNNIRDRMESLKQDPWEDFFSIRQSITQAMRDALGLK